MSVLNYELKENKIPWKHAAFTQMPQDCSKAGISHFIVSFLMVPQMPVFVLWSDCSRNLSPEEHRIKLQGRAAGLGLLSEVLLSVSEVDWGFWERVHEAPQILLSESGRPTESDGAGRFYFRCRVRFRGQTSHNWNSILDVCFKKHCKVLEQLEMWGFLHPLLYQDEPSEFGIVSQHKENEQIHIKKNNKSSRIHLWSS